MRASTPLIASMLLTVISYSPSALADHDDRGHRRHGGREFKEEFWDGNCKVERKFEKDGDYKEKIECKGGDHRHRHAHYKEEYRDGNCKVERKFERDGDYKEERKCRGAPRQHAVVVQPATVVYPPWVVVEQGRPHGYRKGYEPAPVQRGQVSVCNSETVGKVLGGVAGAVVGNQVGQGGGRALATIGGAVAGVLIGGEVGRRMDAGNQACIGQTLELAPAGQRVQWPSGTSQYAVVPGAVVDRGGVYCRPYEAHIRTSAGWQTTQGMACRRTDGVWVQTS
ncbi:glycine zipper 2TM domain-containing protein [Ramlibacter henchirensis]|nr:glycine zipper 2TM domain-containing protein [Ramlibacter henchirensis]